jgi:hypothetical protein
MQADQNDLHTWKDGWLFHTAGPNEILQLLTDGEWVRHGRRSQLGVKACRAAKADTRPRRLIFPHVGLRIGSKRSWPAGLRHSSRLHPGRRRWPSPACRLGSGSRSCSPPPSDAALRLVHGPMPWALVAPRTSWVGFRRRRWCCGATALDAWKKGAIAGFGMSRQCVKSGRSEPKWQCLSVCGSSPEVNVRSAALANPQKILFRLSERTRVL